jgi:hypothetical protein
MIKKLFNDILTEDDGVSFCFAKVISLVVIVWFMVTLSYCIHFSHTVSPDTLGSSVMNVLLGIGGFIAGKQFTQKP